MKHSQYSALLLALITGLSGTTILTPVATAANNTSKCGIDAPNGSAILAPNTVEFPDGSVHSYPGQQCANSPTVNGWIEFGTGGTGSGFSLLSDYWTVPSAPSNTNDPLVYFFNGVQPSGNNWIIQPILAWGCQSYSIWGSCYRGGHNWWIVAAYVPSCWLCSPTYSPVVNVSPGDQIFGRILWLGSGCNGNGGGGPGYEVSAQDVTTNVVTYVYLCNISQGPHGFPGVLEAYRIDHCNQLPNVSSLTFSSISSGPATGWNGGIYGVSPSCSYGVSTSSSSVTLYWNPNG